MKQYQISLILPLLFTISLILEGYFFQKLDFGTQPIYYLVMLEIFFLTRIIAGGGLFILNIIQKKKKAQSDKEPKTLKFLWYFCIGLLDFINWGYYFLPIYFLNDIKSEKIEFVPKSTILIFTSLFCWELLNQKVYSHHILSLILSFSGTLFLFIYQLKFQDLKLKLVFNQILCIGCCLCIGLKDSSEKWMMFYKFKNPSNILLFEGIIEFIVGFIVSLIFCAMAEEENIKEIFFLVLQEKQGIFDLVMFIIFGLLINITQIQTNNKFSPSSRAIADCAFTFQFLLMWKNQNSIYLIGLVPIFLSGLIYNEILLIPFCGLDKNTRVLIDERVRNEQIKLIKDSEETLEESL